MPGLPEPNSGSDLASLSTRAVRDGDDFVITGQKIWTTLAHDAALHVRPGAHRPRRQEAGGHRFLLLDINSPGLKVRPIRDIAGTEEFCEVFLDGVRTHHTNLVGELNRGWTVAKSLLGFERISWAVPSCPSTGCWCSNRWPEPAACSMTRYSTTDSCRSSSTSRTWRDTYGHYAAIVSRGESLGQDVCRC